LGLFSVGVLMGEARLTCVLLAVTTGLLLYATLTAVKKARRVAGASKALGLLSQVMQQRAARATGVPTSRTGAADDADVSQAAAQQQQQHQLVDSSASFWSSWQPASQAVKAAASMLVCNVSLQLLGLIDRTGQDPHDKTQPTSELLVGPDAAWQRAALVAFTAGPLIVMWGVLCAASKLLQAERPSAAAAGGSGDGGDSATKGDALTGVTQMRASKHAEHGAGAGRGVLRCLQVVCASQFVSLGVFWVAQLFGHSGSSMRDLGSHVASALQGPPVSAAAAAVGRTIGLPPGSPLLDALCGLPLRLLLPRVIYIGSLLCLVAAVALAVSSPVLPGSTAAWFAPAAVKVRAHRGLPGVVLLLWLCAVLSGPLVIVLGFKGPATMLLAWLQATGLCKLLRLKAAADAYPGQAVKLSQSSSSAQQQQQQASPVNGAVAGVAGGGVGVVDDGCCSVVSSGAWGLMALQLFFCSGHFCEFSGLQYASAFIGFDDMVWYSSGSLLLINTCGFLFLGPLSLPVFMACSGLLLPCGNSPAKAGAAGSSLQAKQEDETGGSSWGFLQQQVECGLWVMNSMRFAALVVSLISAAVQQQHILLWAIFAPKLVFEMWFMAVTAAGQLLVAPLLPYCLQPDARCTG
jgi:phosphatidylinositol glycan class O